MKEILELVKVTKAYRVKGKKAKPSPSSGITAAPALAMPPEGVDTSATRAKNKFRKNIFYAAKEVSMHIGEAECVGLIGDSGSGKSTIANIVAGLNRATSGEMYFREKELKYPLKGEIRRQIQILFQHPEVAFNPQLKIIDSIREPYKIYRDNYDIQDIIDDVNYLGLREEHLYRLPAELSGGEQQRLALARVLAIKPSLLILDEPTSMLDVISQAMIIDMLKKYQKTYGTSYLFITHNKALADSFCDRLYRIEDGCIQ